MGRDKGAFDWLGLKTKKHFDWWRQVHVTEDDSHTFFCFCESSFIFVNLLELFVTEYINIQMSFSSVPSQPLYMQPRPPPPRAQVQR